ncbi:MAG: type I 3-dehydroquinate dehydratase [Candidatus Caldarchaeum sp.]|nr:type I 3-dehydroquinate dehydratase [Candidatus Caldarchaeum sp.]
MSSATLVCVSVFGGDEDELVGRVSRAIGRGADLVEVRLDLSEIGDSGKLCLMLEPFADRLVLTFRPVDEGGKSSHSREERLRLLEKLAGNGVAYVDFELRYMDAEAGERLRKLCRSLIVSWHNFETTPDTQTLIQTARECLKHGDIAKIVTYSHGPEHNFQIISLYTSLPKGKLIAFCMGEKGWITRVLSMAAGAPITYASLDDLKTAPGQLTLEEMLEMRDRIMKGVSED